MKYPTKDAEILAELYESPAWKIFRKHFHERRRLSLLESSLSASTMEDIKYFRGGTDHIQWVDKEMKGIHKKVMNKEAQHAKEG